MDKKLSDWASIAEIVSGIAVVITLVFLILGIRDNSAVTRASMYAESVGELNALARVIMADPDLSRIDAAFFSQQTADLNAADRGRLRSIVQTRFRNYDIAYSMWNYGHFGVNEWNRYLGLVCLNYRLGISAELQAIVDRSVSPDFKDFLVSDCIE